jgi:hypothetical protein
VEVNKKGHGVESAALGTSCSITHEVFAAGQRVVSYSCAIRRRRRSCAIWESACRAHPERRGGLPLGASVQTAQGRRIGGALKLTVETLFLTLADPSAELTRKTPGW